MAADGARPLADLLTEVLARVDEVVDARRRQALLVEAVVALAADLALESVLQRIVRTACELVGCRYAALGMLGEGSDRRLAAFVHHGISPELREELGDLPRGRGLLGHIIDHPEPVRIPEIGAHPASYGFPPGHPPMRSFLGLPVRIRGTVVGNLYLTDKLHADAFTDDDEAVAVALAAAAGVVIENARLYAESTHREDWLRAGAAAAGVVFRSGITPGALDAVAEHARAASGAVRAQLVLDSEPGPQPPGGLSVPLRAGEEVLGHLVLEELPEDEHGLGDQNEAVRAQGFADQVGVAVALERSRRDRERLVVFEDRDRIARDLHDLVIQRLFAVGLDLDGLTPLVARSDGEAAKRLASSVDELDTTIKDIRRTIFALGDRSHEGVRHALQETVDRIGRHADQRPRLEVEGPVDAVVTSRERGHLLAAVEEALSNAVRHAGARDVVVRVTADAAGVRLCVSDGGPGLPDERVESGLANLRARAESLGGTFALGRRAGGGTEAVWQVPLEPGTGEDR